MLIAEARRKLSLRPVRVAWAERLIDRNLARYVTAARTVDHAAVDFAVRDSPDRPVPDDFKGSIDAVVNPLAAWRGGRTIADGETVALETMHDVARRWAGTWPSR